MNRLPTLVLLVASALTRPVFAQPLPARDDVRDRTLANGLRVLVKAHPTPPGRVVMRLIVGAGSLNESDEERGAARFVEHMAFRGSKRFPGDTARRAFQSLGMELSSHRNAYTTFDHTAYTLEAPGVSEAILNKGLAFLADALDGLTFPEAAVANESSVILEERRSNDSPERRVFDRLLPRLTPGSLLGRRTSAGEEESIAAMTRQRCQEYYRRWYTPSNATLLVVGDIDPAAVDRLIDTFFGPIASRPTPPRPTPGVRSLEQAAGFVETDPDLPTGVIAAINIGPAHAPAVDHASFRRELVDQLTQRLLSRRLDARSFSGDASYAGSGAYLGDVFGGMWIGQIVAFGQADRWRDILGDVVSEMQRARQYGFSDAELTLARDALLAEARSFAHSEPTSPSETIVGLLTESVLSRTPLLTGEQNLALLEELLPTISPKEASDRFAAIFDPARLAFIAELPSGAGVPDDGALLDEARRLASSPVQAPPPPIIIDSLIDTPPRATGVDSVELDVRSRVMTIRLGDGVVVRHRQMVKQAGRVLLRLTLAGGEIEEAAATRGLTSAAANSFDRLATSALTSLTIRDYLASAGVNMSASVSPDALTISIDAPPGKAQTAFELLRLAVTDPVIEPAAISEWRQRSLAHLARRKTQPHAMLAEALADAIYPADEVRPRPLTREQIERVDQREAQRWLEKLLARAPMELSIVGPIGRRSAAELIGRYLGDLPARPTANAQTFDRLCQIAQAPSPHIRTVTIATQTDHAAVAVGFIGPDAADRDGVHVMQIVEKIIRPQMTRLLRDKLGLVSSIGVVDHPARTYPGFGLFLVIARTDPNEASHVADLIERVLVQLARGGPGEYDVAVAQTQIANDAAKALDDPGHWSRRLADLNYRGRSLADIIDEPSAAQNISPTEVRNTLAKFLTEGRQIRIIISPTAE